MERNKIYVENCLTTMMRMADESVDMVITSPPYDELRNYKGYHFPFKDIARNLSRVLKPGGVIVWVVGDQSKNGSETGTSFRQALYFKEACYLNIHDTMIYLKNSCAMPDPTRYLQVFEYMFVFSKGKPKTVNFIEDRRNRFTERWGKGRKVRNKAGEFEKRDNYKANEMGRRFNVWQFNTGGGFTTKDEIAYEHPAIFPEALVSDHIRTWTNEGDLVYDPFGGSGTTAKVSHILKRPWILSEISAHYAEIAERRLRPHLQTSTLFS